MHWLALVNTSHNHPAGYRTATCNRYSMAVGWLLYAKGLHTLSVLPSDHSVAAWANIPCPATVVVVITWS